MFSLHETTRIHLNRAAFVVLCAVPAAMVLTWCGFVHLPAYRHMHERAIESRLGWHAKLTTASSPRPHLMLYEGLELSDPETGQLLALLPAVEVQSSRGQTTIKLPLPATINGRRLRDFWQSSLDATRHAAGDGALQFEAGHVTLHLAGGNQSFADLNARLTSDEHESRLDMHFARATAGETSSEPAELSITRQRESSPPRVTVEFTSGPTPLPCELLASVWPAATRLGRASTLSGYALATEHGGQWTVELGGGLNSVDLDLLMSHFPHKLSGTAQVAFERVVVRDGRVESAAGSLAAGPGTISRSLVHAAQSSLDLDASPRAMTGTENRLPYEKLALDFDIGPDGLTLKGKASKTQGAVLVDERQVLLREPAAGRQPVLNLVRALVPQTAVQVPATRETDALTHFLPVPSVSAQPGQESPLPQARSIRVGSPRK